MKNKNSSSRQLLKIALGSQLARCKAVKTVGIKCNWNDYSDLEKDLIRKADTVYFPTLFFAASLEASGKKIFPSINSYTHLGDKIKQTTLFSLTGVPVPKTRIFFGAQRRQRIMESFSFPFIAKIPVGTGRGEGVFLINSIHDLDEYLKLVSTAYIQEHLKVKRDLRVVVIGKRCVMAYWKEISEDSFRSNVAKGGVINFKNIPEEAVNLALYASNKCGLDHAGFDIAESEDGLVIIEANMRFGTEGFEKAGISYKDVLCGMVQNNEI